MGNSRGVKKLHCTAAVATKRTEMTMMTTRRKTVCKMNLFNDCESHSMLPSMTSNLQ